MKFKQPKAEKGLSNQMLCSFQAKKSCDSKQLKAAVKKGVVSKKWFIQVMVTKSNKISQIFYYNLTENFAIDPCKYQYPYIYKRIYLVWLLWLIMEENGANLVLSVFVSLQ